MNKVEFKNEVYVVEHYDVVVAGGGTAGVSAAVSAARYGAKVCLIEQSSMLGGLGTSGMMTALIGPKDYFGGIGQEVVDELTNRNAVFGCAKETCTWVPYQNETMKSVLDMLVVENNITLYLYTKVIGAIKENHIIKYVILSSVEGNFAIESNMFIDATGDGVLSCFAGESFMLGDENGNTQAPTLTAYYANVDFEKRTEFARADGRGMDEIIHSLLPRAIEEGILRNEDLHHPGVFQIGEKCGVANCGHVYGADCSNARGLTDATVEGRKLAKEYFEFYKKYIPGFENAIYTNTANWLGIRETRRIIGRHICDYNDKLNYMKYDDTVLRYEGGPSTDLHSSNGSREAYQKYFKLFTAKENASVSVREPWVDMPYRALLAKQTDNLFVVGRCVSSDRLVMAQLRVMGYCMMMGQAAGTAAAMCAKDKILTEKINISSLQNRLRQDGLVNK